MAVLWTHLPAQHSELPGCIDLRAARKSQQTQTPKLAINPQKMAPEIGWNKEPVHQTTTPTPICVPSMKNYL